MGWSMGTINKFDEYKLFVDDTARFSERRQTVRSTYVAVNSVLLSAIALLVNYGGLSGRWQTLVAVPLLIAGIAICSSWKQLILDYKKLIGLRMDKLREMETELDGSSRMYHAEDALFLRDEQHDPDGGGPRRSLGFSDLESRLPRIFVWLYVLFLVGIVVSLL
jgi:hypothetical protein